MRSAHTAQQAPRQAAHHAHATPAAVVRGEEVQEILRAANGERRNQNVAAAIRRPAHDGFELLERGVEGAVIAIAVSALHEHEDGLLKDGDGCVHHEDGEKEGADRVDPV